MTHWWEIPTGEQNEAPKARAVAYYRHSAQDRQENSIPLVKVLEPGERKSIQNQRVTLTEGAALEAAVIRRIFHEFVELGYSEYKIAERLIGDGISAPGGGQWAAGMVIRRLRNEKYAGAIVYNQTSQKLKTPRRRNPQDKWVISPEAFEGIVSPEIFARAQEILEKRRRKYDPDVLLRQLDALYQEHGLFRYSLLRMQDDAPSTSAFGRCFGSLDFAFQKLFDTERDRARQLVHDQICQRVPEVLPYSDFLVLDRKLSLSIQPAVPIPHGYTAYWPFRPDGRHVIDLTLGVLLSAPRESEILGYVALPRWFAGNRTFRFSSGCIRTELFGRSDLDFLKQLLDAEETQHGQPA